MPPTCPRCRTALAAGSETCNNCGQPPTSAPAAPDARRAQPAPRAGLAPGRARPAPWWLPALFAVGLLLALTVSALFLVARGPARHAARSAGPSPDSSVGLSPEAAGPPAAPAPAVPWVRPPVKTAAKKILKPLRKAVPLRVVLTPPSQGRHVRVGEDVTLTALAQGRCASLTLSYRRGHGGATTHSFTEGGLLSTTWTPAAPGRYEFTATALGGPRQTAVSRPVEITVDGPAPQRMARAAPARAFPAEVITPLPPLAVRLPPLPRTVPRTVSLTVPRPPLPLSPWVKPAAAAPPAVPETVASRAAPLAPRALPAVTYHVAAAQFPLSRSAVVLAKAFRLRGSAATTKRMIGYHGRTVYAVVTGAYRRPEEARAAVLVLQRSGYPAYFFGG